MSYLIDTNVITEIRKGARCDIGVSTWFASIADEDIFLSVLLLGEIREGIEHRVIVQRCRREYASLYGASSERMDRRPLCATHRLRTIGSTGSHDRNPELSAERNLTGRLPRRLPKGGMVMKYAIVIEKLADNYCAHVPDLQVCVSTGTTLEEVRTNIHEAMALYLETMRNKGMEPPIASTRVEEYEIA